ncbi:MAG: hypothetical protein IJS57_00580 [Paludibacteraceae bacterium]|nr:hypothetical protein [Paludibacteraceae bacterium]
MERIATLIQIQCPDYKSLASCVYNYSYSHQWCNPIYQGNPIFEELKRKYGTIPLDRQMIINLFAHGKYYDGFLCALVWGNFCSRLDRNGKVIFESIFDANIKIEICDKINSVIEYLQNQDIENAYRSLDDKKKNGIDGIGQSFFTKLLYFAGSTVNNLSLQPLIFDDIMANVYKNILTILDVIAEHKTGYPYYETYLKRMDELARLLKLNTTGHVEALLFSPDIKKILADEAQNKLTK